MHWLSPVKILQIIRIAGRLSSASGLKVQSMMIFIVFRSQRSSNFLRFESPVSVKKAMIHKACLLMSISLNFRQTFTVTAVL